MSVHNANGIPAGTGRIEIGNSLNSVKPEEIILISKQSRGTTEPSFYDVFSLSKEAGERGPSFNLSKTRIEGVQLSLLEEFLIGELPEYLRSGPSRHVHLVVSTGSGTGLSLKFYNSVLRPLLESWGLLPLEPSADLAQRSTPNTYNLVITQNTNSVRDFAQDLSSTSRNALQHTVILLSGDGGVIEILNGRAPIEGSETETHLPLIVTLPLGTGNALFHSLHKSVNTTAESPVPSSLVRGLRTLFKGRVALLPSFKAEFSPGSRLVAPASSEAGVDSHTNSISHLYGAIVASYGFHSQLVWESDTPEYRKHGAKRFGMVAQRLLKDSHAYNAIVELAAGDGSQLRNIDRYHHAYILATMVSDLEETFTISPSSKPLDGKLRLVHFGVVSGQKTTEIMMGAYAGGKHVGMKWFGEDGKEEQVGYDEAELVKITTLEEDARWRKVCIDGTIVELPQGGYMTVKTENQPHLQVLVDHSVIG